MKCSGRKAKATSKFIIFYRTSGSVVSVCDLQKTWLAADAGGGGVDTCGDEEVRVEKRRL